MKTILALFILIFIQNVYSESINHIEYGATNHAGENPNSVNNDIQFTGITASLKELLKTYEPRGRIYLNDIDESGLLVVADYLKAYLNSKSIEVSILSVEDLKNKSNFPSGIEIVLLPGDMTTVSLPKTKTAMLRNPAPAFLRSLLYSASAPKIQRLIDASKNGLQVVTRKTSYTWGQLDGIDLIEDLYPRDSSVRKIKVDYRDFSAKKGMFSTYWAEGDKITGDYFKVSIKNKTCWSYY